jgi:hypothetical protein
LMVAAAAPSRTGDPAAQRLGDEATLHRFVVARDGDLAKVRRNGCIRARAEIMGAGKCGIVGKSQPGLIMINPMISTRQKASC